MLMRLFMYLFFDRLLERKCYSNEYLLEEVE